MYICEVYPMKIPCISCNSMFQLNNKIIKPTGSLVRCSKCNFIFIVHPQEFNEQPIGEDTRIDQSILFDLFGLEHPSRTELPLDDIAKEWNSLLDQGVFSIEDFDEETVEEFDSSNVDTECEDLPDLSEFENMIDWGDDENFDEPSAT